MANRKHGNRSQFAPGVVKETHAINLINLTHIKEEAGAGEIILEELDFYWTHKDQEIVVRMWEAGCHIDEICKHFKNRHVDEVALLIMHLRRHWRIKKRKRGLKGN